MSNNIAITQGSGTASVATEQIGTVQYQKIKVVGGETGSTSVMGVNPDGTINVSVKGVVATTTTGSVIAVIQGSVTAIPTGNQSVSGAVTAPPGSVMTVVTPAGSVMTVIATAPGGSIMSTIHPAGSVGAVLSQAPAGSIMSVTNPAGSVTAVLATAPSGSIMSITTPAGSVQAVRTDNASIITTQLAGSLMAVIATAPAGSILSITHPAGSVTGVRTDNASVITTQLGGSVMTVATLAGSIMSVSATQPAGSIMTVITPAGSVQAVRTDLASVITVTTVVGSVIATLQGASIVGTYAEDAASASADKGLFSLNVRNDTLSSVTSTDGDYSALTVGPSGEVITANAPLTKWIQGTADFRQGNTGASIQIIAVGGTSVFTYITAAQVANLGSASVLVTLASSGSILGFTIAPAGGGSNLYYPNALKTPSNGNFAASLSGIASVLISAQGFTAKI